MADNESQEDSCCVRQFRNFSKVIGVLNGRDKINKSVQFGAKFMFYVMTQMDLSETGALKCKKLSAGIGHARRVDRLLKSTEEIQKAINAINSKKDDDFAKYLTVLSASFLAMRWFNDNKVFLGKIKAIEGIDVKQANTQANRYWLYGLSIVVYLLIDKMRKLYQQRASESDEEELKKLNDDISLKRVQLIGFCCDLLCASNNAGFLEKVKGSKLNDGVMGALGFVSASTVLYRIWPSQ
eukprot:1148512_1